jgi:hypothetical protein
MAFPVIKVLVNFSTGPSFAQVMILDTGTLDTNILGDSASLIVDISNLVDMVDTTRGRNLTADQFQTGTASVRVQDQNGDWNPQNVSGPYYGKLNPMTKIQITASYSGVTYSIFSGFITNFNTVVPDNILGSQLTYTTLVCVDAMRLANLAMITTVAGATAGDLTGTRVNQILDQINWPASMRSIAAGLTTVQADPGTSRTSLAAMQNIELTEFGGLYVSADGSFTFQDRYVTTSSVANTPTVFSDAGSGIRYFDSRWQLSDILIYNNANITATGLATQKATTVTGDASIIKYFSHTYTASGLLMQTEQEALNYGLAFVTARAETSIRCDLLTLDLYAADYDLGIKAGLGMDFFDPVTITTTQPGGTSITKTEQIFGIAMQIRPNAWKVNFTTMEALIDGFILDSASFGILDTNVLSY